MSHFHKSDDVLGEWQSLANRATPPTRAPRGGRSGSQLRLAFAGVVALVIVAAILAPRVLTSPGPATSGSPSATGTGSVTASPVPVATPTPIATNQSQEPTPEPTPAPTATAAPSGSSAVTTVDCSTKAGSPTFTISGTTSEWRRFTWAPIPAGSPLAAFESGIFQWHGLYVAHGSVGSKGIGCIWTSPDGLTWTSAFEAPTLVVAPGPKGLVAITEGSTGSPDSQAVWTSSDGSHWTDAGKAKGIGTVSSLGGTTAGLVAVTSTQTGSGKFATTKFSVAYSTDGLNWTPDTIEPGLVWDEVGPIVQAGNGRFFVMGGSPATAAYDQGAFRLLSSPQATPVLFWSDDGRAWHLSTGGGYYGDSIDFGSGGMILHSTMRAIPGGTEISLSTDGGRTWQADSTFSPFGFQDCTQVQGECSTGPDGVIGSNGSLFLAVKNDGHAWTSNDGKTWTSIPWGGPSPLGVVVLPGGVIVNGQYGAAN